MPASPGVASSSNRAPPRGRAFGNGSDPSGRSGETPPPSILASRPLRSSRGGPRRQSAAYSRATDSLSWRTGDLLVANVDASGRCTASPVAGRCGVPGQTSRWARFSSTVATNCDAVTRNCSDGCWHDASFPRVARGDGGVVAQKWNKCFIYEMRWYVPARGLSPSRRSSHPGCSREAPRSLRRDLDRPQRSIPGSTARNDGSVSPQLLSRNA